MTTVERVEVERLSLPLHSPFTTARRRATTADSVIVRVTDSDGPGRAGRGAAELARARHLGGRVRGLPGRTAAGRRARPARGPRGALAAARPCGRRQHSCQGRAGQRPARPRRRAGVRAADTGRPCRSATRTQVAEAARARVAEGFRTLKLKVGTDEATDVARVRACREGAGPDVALRVDANTGWDCFEAVRVIRALEDAGLGVELVEQPVARHDLAGMAYVRRHVATPVMADESVFDLADLVEVVRHEAADQVNLKVSKTGGITPALELARVARLHGLAVSVGCMVESAVGVGRRRGRSRRRSAATSCPTSTVPGGSRRGRRTPTG